MIDFVIQLKDAEAVRALKASASAETRRTVMQAAGQEVRVAAIQHFRNRETEPENTSGFPKFGQSFGKQGFWSGNKGTSVAEAVGEASFSYADQSVTIPIDSPALAHKADPNPPLITPKGGRKFLAIPANARAAMWAGMPSDFNISGGLKFGYAPDAAGRWHRALVAREDYLRVVARGKNAGQRALAAAGKGTLGAAMPQYWLISKVQTRHDPRAMPDPAALSSRAAARAESTLLRLCPS